MLLLLLFVVAFFLRPVTFHTTFCTSLAAEGFQHWKDTEAEGQALDKHQRSHSRDASQNSSERIVTQCYQAVFLYHAVPRATLFYAKAFPS